MAGSRDGNRLLIWPGTSGFSIADFTAPQLEWPITTMALRPSTATPYSRLPMISGVVMLPAMRHVNRRPMGSSKTISTGTRESAQASTPTVGH